MGAVDVSCQPKCPEGLPCDQENSKTDGAHSRALTPGILTVPVPGPPTRTARPLLAVGSELQGVVREEAQAGHRIPLPQGPGPLGPPHGEPCSPWPSVATSDHTDLG